MASAVKFDIPAFARSFTCFSRLPPEIRQQIWEDAIFEPGMHFLRLKTAARIRHLPSPLPTGHFDGDDEEEEDDPLLDFAREKIPSRVWPATLEPRYPTPQANISNYLAVNRVLNRLSATCFESASVVRRLTNAPGGLKLKGGHVVSLGGSCDVVCLEYLSADDFRSWCRMSLDIECKQLAKIRHVAIPYCHAWEASVSGFRCSHCGNRHGGGAQKVYPVHLYEFLARYLPNLQTFYFIDYLIVKKNMSNDSPEGAPEQIMSPPPDVVADREPAFEPSKKRTKEDAADGLSSPNKVAGPVETMEAASNDTKPEATPSSSDPKLKVAQRVFKCEGRVFCQFDEDHWDVKSRVVDTMSWLQKRFILYANRSKLSKHAHPENVQFKILSCEWDEREPDAQPRLKRAAQAVKRALEKKPRPQHHSHPLDKEMPPMLNPTTPPTSPFSPSLSTSIDGFDYIFGREEEWDFAFSQVCRL
ncbi:hypothetical protein CORC01_04664 [Colletotrichum orchidophilum]|uniref:2EXR domain-containing protein n=1 Tax=Colletotrichum orchidophilum TaxID=1209926 RepID=A0A1G4BF91_9PEZI|nr:uncharacterized protein CORC01_04664 [Colletotrichum orchidophilum]OHF00018.1 hypothetical protein CORC01_04664 [Colletotrichum orchidophilum]